MPAGPVGHDCGRYAMTAHAAVAAPGTALRLTLELLFIPGAASGRCVGAVWSCSSCGSPTVSGDLVEALDGFGDHCLRHHGQGSQPLREQVP